MQGRSGNLAIDNRCTQPHPQSPRDTLRDVPWCPSTQLSVPTCPSYFCLLLANYCSLSHVCLRLVLFAVCVFVFWKSPPFSFFLSLLTTADSSSLSSEGEWAGGRTKVVSWARLFPPRLSRGGESLALSSRVSNEVGANIHWDMFWKGTLYKWQAKKALCASIVTKWINTPWGVRNKTMGIWQESLLMKVWPARLRQKEGKGWAYARPFFLTYPVTEDLVWWT